MKWPPPTPDAPKWLDRALTPDEFTRADPGILVGTWLTSYSGLSLFSPTPEQLPDEPNSLFARRTDNLPPILGGYRWVPPPESSTDADTIITVEDGPGTYVQREGYFAIAGLTCLALDPFGKLSGFTQFNRGAAGGKTMTGFARSLLWGDFMVARGFPAKVYEGAIRIFHKNQGGMLVEHNWAFTIRTVDEIEWVWSEGSERPFVTHGTLRRVTHAPLQDGTDDTGLIVTPDLPELPR